MIRITKNHGTAPATLYRIFFLLVLLCPMLSLPARADAAKPNIIFIMADDLGAEALACYGNDTNKTPNLDRLAAQGMRFTQAYSTPLCTPTRVQVMTGKYNYRNYTGFGLLDKSETTFADLLKEAGYATGVTGKWQLLGNKKQRKLAGGKTGAYPQEVGFDDYCLWQVEELGSRYKDPTVTHTTGTKTYDGKYGPDIFAEFALNFIEKNRDRPFFLYYPMVLTHDPFQPPPDHPDFAKVSEKPGKPVKDPVYFEAMVRYMDKIVGKVAAKVDELGLSKKTLIIFTGDNGTGRDIVSLVNGKEIHGGKGRTHKYGTNVPLIAYWDGTIKPGQVNDNLIDFTDFLPTFMSLARAQLPPDHQGDGLSFRGQLLNEDSPVRDWVFCSYNPRWKSDFKATWANDKQWKLYTDGRFFNIQNDPAEEHPLTDESLSAEAREAKQKLSAVLRKHDAQPPAAAFSQDTPGEKK